MTLGRAHREGPGQVHKSRRLQPGPGVYRAGHQPCASLETLHANVKHAGVPGGKPMGKGEVTITGHGDLGGGGFFPTGLVTIT
ncbi:MAG: hypothetical protein AB1445_04795 [Bacillota bacterium]